MQAVIAPPPPDLCATPRMRWTRAQYEAIEELAILTEPSELIDGEIVAKMGQNPPHAYVIRVLMSWLSYVFGAEFLQCQLPIDVPEKEKEANKPLPDVAVNTQEASAYARRHPGPGDLRLVVEVSDSTLAFDQSAKADLFARAGIVEYWIVDIAGRNLFVHRQPTPTGYEDIRAYRADEEIAPLAQPDAMIRVARLLPPED
jgi:Uma2 family endonuclease